MSDSLDSLQALSDGHTAFEQQLRHSGVYVVELDQTERDAFQTSIEELDSPPHEFTDRHFRLLAPEGDTSALFDTLAQLFLEMPDLADILIRRGLTLDVEDEQVEVLREALTGQATVTILDREFRLHGRVTHRETGEPLPDVALDAIFRTDTGNLLVRRSSVDASGEFSVSFDPGIFREVGDARVDVSFRVWRDNEQINREPIILVGLEPRGQRFDIEVLPPRAEAGTHHVRGRVLDRVTGDVLAGVKVDARFYTTSSHNLLQAGTVADEDGAYTIPFSGDLLDRSPAGERVDVVFTVHEDGMRLESPPGALTRVQGVIAGDQSYDIRVVRPVSFVLSGLVVDDRTRAAIPGVALDFYFVSPTDGRLLRTATVADAAGRYRTTFTSTIFAALEADRRVDVSCQAFLDDRSTPTRVVLRGLRPQNTALDVAVDGAALRVAQVERQVVFGGQVVDADVAGLRVEVWDGTGSVDSVLGASVTDDDGAFRMVLNASRLDALVADGAPELSFRVYRGNRLVDVSGNVLSWGPDAIVDDVTIRLLGESTPDRYRVSGRVTGPAGISLGGLRISVVDLGVGSAIELAEAVTEEDGAYAASFTSEAVRARGKERPDLEVRVFSGERQLGIGGPRFDALPSETVNIALDQDSVRGLGSEYETLLAAIRRHYDGDLADLEEADGGSDITFLAGKTGWDARAIAFVRRAELFARRSTEENAAIEAPFFYGLLRAGFPQDYGDLLRTRQQDVARQSEVALERGILPSSLRETLPAALTNFQALSERQIWDTAPVPGTSSLGEIAKAALGDDAETRSRFAALMAREEDPRSLWQAAEAAFGEEAVARLQLDTRLAHLTQSNAPLISRLHSEAGPDGLRTLRQLVAAGFHRSAQWREVLADAPVPESFIGDEPDAAPDRYAKALAAQLRGAFPTATVARMLREEEVPIASPELRDGVAAFLERHEDAFDVAAEPIARFVARRDRDADQSVIAEVARLQRVGQITPDLAAMSALLARGYESSEMVARTRRESFVRRVADAVGGEDAARAIHEKATQVRASVLNIFTSYAAARTAPGIGARSAPSHLDVAPKRQADSSGAPAQATLEKLFGEMDYCACEHCRSELGPAAYLVELLDFINPEDRREDSATAPISVLRSRRPDIEHLPLTCENTDELVPYIALANEAMDHFLAHDLSLKDYAHPAGSDARDGSASDPATVAEAADAELRASFPPPLPYDHALARLRRHLEVLNAPLDEIRESLRPLEGDTGEAAEEDWGAIWVEALGLSPAEASLFKGDGGRDAGDDWDELRHVFGFDGEEAQSVVRESLQRAKLLCRRIGLSYQDLAAILETRFCNPAVELLPRVRRLGLSFREIQALQDRDGGAVGLPEGLDPEDYDGDPLAWVAGHADMILSLVVLVSVGEGDDHDPCSFDDLELRTVGEDLVEPVFFARIMLFVRLWKALGWTIGATDAAISALQPDTSDEDTIAGLKRHFQILLPRLGILRRTVKRLGIREAPPPLLVCLGSTEPADAAQDWFARKLRISRWELDRLAEVTGITPFGPPAIVRPHILRFIDLIERLRSLRVSPGGMLSLIWALSPEGGVAPGRESTARLAVTLRSAFEGLLLELAPSEISTRQLLATVYGSETADFFFALFEGSFTVEQVYDHDGISLGAAIEDAGGGRLSYDDFAKQLSFRGRMTTKTRDDLCAVEDVSEEFSNAVQALHKKSEAATGPFLARYPELGELLELALAYAGPEGERWTFLYARIPSELGRRRLQQQAVQSIAAAAEIDGELVEALLRSPNAIHAAARPNAPALDDVTALTTPGLSARYYRRARAEGDSEEREVEGPIDNDLPLPNDAEALSVAWAGYLAPPENGFYKIRIDCTAESVALGLNGRVALESDDDAWENASAIELRAGTPVPLSLTVEDLRGPIALKWQRPGSGWQTIPATHMYAGRLIDNLHQVHARVMRAGALANALGLSATEMSFLARRGENWLNRLPMPGDEVTGAGPLLEALETLLAFANIKRATSGRGTNLLDLLEGPERAVEAVEKSEDVAGMASEILNDLMAHFSFEAEALSDLRVLEKLRAAHSWVARTRVPARTLIEAVRYASRATVRAFEAALQRHYGNAAWAAIVGSVDDDMHALRRDALVACILHRMSGVGNLQHIDTPGELFEFFLMDVQMEPCMMTSRVRQVTSSVQLFIERCVMNLEPEVAPSEIPIEQWEWMKSYPLWEAMRRVLLYPENWLEPDLRDDQSPIFREVMSKLLQGDITEDRATEAYLEYVVKLDEVAKLEICGADYQEAEPGRTETLHVLGRTEGARRKYFHRVRSGASWSPWEQVRLDIEDNPVLPVVWKKRLFVFWLKLIQETEQPQELPDLPPEPLNEVPANKLLVTRWPKIRISAILNWSEHLNGSWQAPRTSDPSVPHFLGTTESAANFRSKLRLVPGVLDDGLHVYVFGSDEVLAALNSQGIQPSIELRSYVPTFVLLNTRGAPKQVLDPYPEPLQRKFEQTSEFRVVYRRRGDHFLLEGEPRSSIVQPHPASDGKAPWRPPFFYQDAEGAFLVKTTAFQNLNLIAEQPDPLSYLREPPINIENLVVLDDADHVGKRWLFGPNGQVFGDSSTVFAGPQFWRNTR